MAPSSTPSLHRNYVNPKKTNWERYSKDIEETLSTEPNPTDCQQGEKILRAAILKAASHHIPSGRHNLDHTEALPADIVDMMSARDDLRSRDPTSPALSQMNDEINQAKNRHKRDKWGTFLETLTTSPLLQNCGELSRHWTANQRRRLRTKPSPSMALKYLHRSR